MTIDDVIAVVESESGKKVTADTEIKDLGLDSLDFLSLLIAVGPIDDLVVPRIDTVNDLYLAAIGQL